MRKIICVLLIVASAHSAFAVFSPTYEKPTKGEFTSPARIMNINQKTPFSFNIKAGSDIDALSFFANPAGSLSGKPAEKLAKYLAGKDLSFWEENTQIIEMFASLDDNFPKYTQDDYFLAGVREYFATNFLSDAYGDDRRAYAVLNSMSLTDAYTYDASRILGGDTYLSMELYGGKISNGFGWNWDINMNYDGAPSLLDGLGNRISMDMRANIAYAFSLGERIHAGVSVQPMLRFQMNIPNQTLISARMNDDVLYIFSDNLMFGTGLSINIGTMYTVNENLMFTLDLRNAPAFRNYAILAVTDIANGDIRLQEDKTIYYIPTDIALTAYWEKERFDISVEVSDIMSQLIYNNEVENREFDYYSILKLSMEYNIKNDLYLTARYRYRAIALGLKYHGMEAEISTKLNKLAIGISFGWTF